MSFSRKSGIPGAGNLSQWAFRHPRGYIECRWIWKRKGMDSCRFRTRRSSSCRRWGFSLLSLPSFVLTSTLDNRSGCILLNRHICRSWGEGFQPYSSSPNTPCTTHPLWYCLPLHSLSQWCPRHTHFQLRNERCCGRGLCIGFSQATTQHALTYSPWH